MLILYLSTYCRESRNGSNCSAQGLAPAPVVVSGSLSSRPSYTRLDPCERANDLQHRIAQLTIQRYSFTTNAGIWLNLYLGTFLCHWNAWAFPERFVQISVLYKSVWLEKYSLLISCLNKLISHKLFELFITIEWPNQFNSIDRKEHKQT